MKRILKLIPLAFIICLIATSLVSGQDKKSEQKIKIVVNDGSGTKVVIDTLITNGNENDSIKLKNGKVIFIGHSGDDTNISSDISSGNIVVTESSEGKGSGNNFKTITVVSSGSETSSENPDSNKVYVYNYSKKSEGKTGFRYKVITSDANDGGKDSSVENTKYVIAKDGMVVTVEGNDEAKAKELMKVIEDKLGVNNEGTDNKETIKTKTKKIIKK